MKIKNLYLASLALISFGMVAEEVKWGVSLGYEKIEQMTTMYNFFLFSFHPDSATLSCSDWPLQRK